MKKTFAPQKDFLFLLPSLLGVSVFVFLPFGDVVRRSFTSLDASRFTGFENYRAIWDNTAFRLAMGNTLKFLSISIPLLLAASLLLANMVHFGRHSICTWYKKFCLLPMAVPTASLVFVWNMLFHRFGILNSILNLSTDWLHSSLAFAVLTLSFLWKNTGYYVILWLTGLQGIPKSLYEAAALDGAPGPVPLCNSAGAETHGLCCTDSGSYRCLQILPGNLSSVRGVSGQKYLHDTAYVPQLVSGHGHGKDVSGRSGHCMYFRGTGISVPQKRRWEF